MLWHKPIIVELALDFSAALRVKVDWPLATKPYDAEPDSSESYAAQLPFNTCLLKPMFIDFPSQQRSKT